MPESESAARVRRHRAKLKVAERSEEFFQMGYRGSPSPFADLDWSQATQVEIGLNLAWARGVWRRQAELSPEWARRDREERIARAQRYAEEVMPLREAALDEFYK